VGLLGVPIDERDYCNKYALDLVNKVIKDTHEPISKLEDPQAATLLLNSFFSLEQHQLTMLMTRSQGLTRQF
jgi:hypothetical protein